MNELRVVIVEDEPATARNLAFVLQNINKHLAITEMLTSVRDSISWFASHEGSYDLIFMDIRLSDGISFDIFRKISIKAPVVFVTAYHNYAIEAFKNNGIDYILKPIDEQEVEQALQKYLILTDTVEKNAKLSSLELLFQQLNLISPAYKRSFLLHYRDKLIPVQAANISWFYTANEIVYARTVDDKEFTMDSTMEQLEQQLDPQSFFRANRQFIVNRSAIVEVEFFFNGRLCVIVKPAPDERVLVSKARAPEFKAWMNQ